MTPFIDVPHVGQGILFTLTLLILTAGMICAAVSVHYKVSRGKISVLVVSVAVEFVLFWLLQVGYIEVFKGREVSGVGAAFNGIPVFAVALYIVLIFAWTVFYAVRLKKFINGHITAMSIKESMDKLPAGLCFYAENGLPLLVNHIMAYICLTATGKGLLSGAEFWNSLSCGEITSDNTAVQISDTPVIKLSDGTVKSFVRYEIDDGGQKVYELVAYDVTAQYALSMALESENEN